MSAALVMDASVVFAWVLPNQASPGADALLTRIEAGATVAVPSSEMTEWTSGKERARSVDADR